jgi:hypothetical protein
MGMVNGLSIRKLLIFQIIAFVVFVPLVAFLPTLGDATGASNIQINHPPDLQDIPTQIVAELSPFSIILTATDPDVPTQTLTFSAPDKPDWVTINESTGEITGTPPEGSGGNTYAVIVMVRDDGTPRIHDLETFLLTVTEGDNSSGG